MLMYERHTVRLWKELHFEDSKQELRSFKLVYPWAAGLRTMYDRKGENNPALLKRVGLGLIVIP